MQITFFQNKNLDKQKRCIYLKIAIYYLYKYFKLKFYIYKFYKF